MHSVFAESLNLSEVKDPGIQIHTIHYHTIMGHRNLHPRRQLSGLLGDVILDYDWLPTTLPEN